MSTNPRARAWLDLHADALLENYRGVRAAIGPAPGILPMVKADAYGLGMADVVRVLEREEPWGYGVATVDEGERLRALGVGRPVVVCGPTPPGSVGAAIEAGLDLTVSSSDMLRVVAEGVERLATPARIHVEIDTGMGRSGFDWRTAFTWLPEVAGLTTGRVTWVGCSTHLHSADEGSASIEEQWRRFEEVLAQMGDSPPGLVVHGMNSPGLFRTPEHAMSLVRPGIYLYGGRIGAGQPVPRTVASLRARVVHVRDAVPGTTLGYGATYRAERPERWATLGIGYGDGLPRILGGRGSALIRGTRVPMIGRISMDVTVVNITDAPGVGVGDIATLFGADGGEEVTVDEVAELAGTISYEILTGLTSRVPRVWSDDDGS